MLHSIKKHVYAVSIPLFKNLDLDHDHIFIPGTYRVPET